MDTRGAEVEREIAHRLGAEVDQKVVDDAAVDLVVGQDVALVLIGQCSGDLGRQLGVMLDKKSPAPARKTSWT